MSYDLTTLENGCQELGIQLNGQQKEQFIKFYEYLIEKNKVMNLTGITDFEEVLTKHFLDSLSCVKSIDMTKVKTMIDIGTGAGFPGVPLKIAFPHLQACLLDSLKKRVNFLEESFQLLGLTDITAIHGRAEEYARNKEYREQYDLCVSRAVSNLATLSEYCLPYVKKGGSFMEFSILDALILFICAYLLLIVINLNNRIKVMQSTLKQMTKQTITPDHPI